MKFLCFLLLFLPVHSFCANQAELAAEGSWLAFRERFPFHVQTLAASGIYDDGSILVLISEPPPHLTQELLLAQLEKAGYTAGFQVRTHPIGLDGWVRDILLTVQLRKGASRKEFLRSVYQIVFGDTYKAECWPLDRLPEPGAAEGINLSVQPAEWVDWIGQEEQFGRLDDPNFQLLEDWLFEGEMGVFYSRRPGLVAWVLPRGELDGWEREARQFFLDSDVLLGAVASSQNLAIIGRERQEPTWVLPPLRLETVWGLAAVPGEEVLQSFERENPFAGRLSNGMDWAPIYLSPEFVNTELGSLLNLTDQLLKAWSCNGQVRYQQFSYPVPATWPFETSLPESLESQMITFNWNTKDYAYVAKGASVSFFGIHQTGALPVSYIPEFAPVTAPKAGPYEQKGHDWFAAQQDPLIFRAAQYAGLFQLFRNFGVVHFTEENAISAYPQAAAKQLMAELIEAVLKTSDPELDQWSTELVNRRFNMGNRPPDPAMAAVLGEMTQQVAPELKMAAYNLKQQWKSIEEVYGRMGTNLFLSCLADPYYATHLKIRSKEEYDLVKAANGASELLGSSIRLLAESWKGRDESFLAYQEYQKAPDGWIHTPSAVVSRWVSRKETTSWMGGHNIGAGVEQVIVDEKVPVRPRDKVISAGPREGRGYQSEFSLE